MKTLQGEQWYLTLLEVENGPDGTYDSVVVNVET